jgi:hypothetical protein
LEKIAKYVLNDEFPAEQTLAASELISFVVSPALPR